MLKNEKYYDFKTNTFREPIQVIEILPQYEGTVTYNSDEYNRHQTYLALSKIEAEQMRRNLSVIHDWPLKYIRTRPIDSKFLKDSLSYLRRIYNDREPFRYLLDTDSRRVIDAKAILALTESRMISNAVRALECYGLVLKNRNSFDQIAWDISQYRIPPITMD